MTKSPNGIKKRTKYWSHSFKVRIVLALVFTVLIFSACGKSPPPGSGDPGNHILDELRADPVFGPIPPNSHMVGPIVLTPAKWEWPGTWQGADVTVTFYSNLTAEQVLIFINNLATHYGWVPSLCPGCSPIELRGVNDWGKTLPGNHNAYLAFMNSPVTVNPSATGLTWTLAGSVSV